MNGLAFDDLIADTAAERRRPATQLITEITDDSRRVMPGVPVHRPRPRRTADGVGWQAMGGQTPAPRAPAAVLAPDRRWTCPTAWGWPLPRWWISRWRPRLAARFFGHPARGLKLVGITGTNGKTTVATIVQHLW